MRRLAMQPISASADLASEELFGRQRWKVLGITSAASFMVYLDTTIVNIAFPSISRSFPHASRSSLSWILNAYTITFAALLITVGRTADIRGRKRLFLTGILLFTAGSVSCGLAPNELALIAARSFQAFGAAALISTALALLLPAFPVHQRSTAVGLWGAVGAVAAAVGPSAGSALVQAGGWRWVFFVNVPIGALAWVLGRRILSESKDPEASAAPDYAGSILLAVAMALLSLSIVQIRDWGPTDPRIISALIASVAVLWRFLARSARHRSPVLDLRLFRIKRFSVANAAACIFAAAFYAALLNNVLFLTQVWHYSIMRAGIAITPGPIAAATVAGMAGRRADRHGHRHVIVLGALLYVLAYCWFIVRVGPHPAYFTEWLPGALVLGTGAGMAFPTIGSAAATALPPALFGVGSGVIGTSRQLGATMGIAGVIAILGTPTPEHALAAFDRAWISIAAAALATALIASRLGPRRSRPVQVEDNSLIENALAAVASLDIQIDLTEEDIGL